MHVVVSREGMIKRKVKIFFRSHLGYIVPKFGLQSSTLPSLFQKNCIKQKQIENSLK